MKDTIFMAIHRRLWTKDETILRGGIGMPIINAVAHFDLGFVPVDNQFILNHMPKANGIYVKIYLYTLYTCLQSSDNVSTADIAEALDLLESDVIQGLNYWTSQNLMKLNQTDEQLSIEFLHPRGGTQVEVQQNQVAATRETPARPPLEKGKILVEKRPQYSQKELLNARQSQHIKTMLLIAERYLGKVLTPTDVNTLYSFHDWLGLPTDVIELLIEYCADNNKRHMNYIEKVAISWAEHGINTPQKAEQQILLFNKKYRRIMKAFGLASMDPTESQVEYMNRWLDEYKMSIELIIEACNRTIKNISKPSFQYAESIISSWVKNKVRTLDDIIALDANYAKKKTFEQNNTKPSGGRKNTAPNQQYGKTKFINFKQRTDVDYDTIERKLLEGRS